MIVKPLLIIVSLLLLVSCDSELGSIKTDLYKTEVKEGNVVEYKDGLLVADENFDSNLMVESLEGILSWHKQHNPDFSSQLNKGLSEAELDRLEGKLGYRLSEELKILYRWRNGSKSDHPFIWYHRFIPLESAVSLVKKITNLYEWEEGWLPVFEFEGEYIFVKLREANKKALPVYLAFPYSNHAKTYVNLTMYLATANEVLHFPDLIEVESETGSLMQDDIEPIRNIYARYNPGLEFPYR